MKKLNLINGLLLLVILILTSCSQSNKVARRVIVFDEADAGVYRLVTFNIRSGTADDGDNAWEHRKELVFDTLADHKADIIALQEAVEFQVTQIKRALPQYDVVWAGRDDGKRGGEACPVLFRRDRFTLTDSETFWFSNSPWRPGSMHWGNQYPRICTWVRLVDTTTGRGVYVYNLHLDHLSQASRTYSVNLLLKEIAARAHEGDAVVVMGDFNMDTDNEAMAAFRRIARGAAYEPMLDVWDFLHPGETPVATYHAFGTRPEGPCVDHILIEPDARIIEAAIDRRSRRGRYPSDHYPVIAEIMLPNQ